MTYDEMVKKFPVGTLVRLVISSGITAQPGAIAVVIGHKQKYNEVYLDLQWDRTNSKCGSQQDGGYLPHHFEVVTVAKTVAYDITTIDISKKKTNTPAVNDFSYIAKRMKEIAG